MKKVSIIVSVVAVLVLFATSVSTVFAGKPADVIPLSNGMPSGMHFNLNIHGKADTFSCDATSGGNSIFVKEYGEATIQYISNKRSSVTELTVLDACAVTDGLASVQLPTQIGKDTNDDGIDDVTIPVTGYTVYARILGKPNNGKSCPAGETCNSSVLLYPNIVYQACNDNTTSPDPNFGDYTSCSDAVYALGLITWQGTYDATPEGFYRFNEEASPTGKGRSMGKDITRLFTWTGWVLDDSLDLDLDGDIDENDIPGTYIPADYNLDGVIDIVDWFYFMDSDPLTTDLVTYYDSEWIFNIADLVVTDQQLDNDGTKLLQIRFYPYFD